MEAKRLNKFIADSGYCSRREADRLIAEGRVRVDGRMGALGDQVQPACAWRWTASPFPDAASACI